MKNYVKTVIAFGIIYILGLVVFVLLSAGHLSSSNDTVVLNDITKKIEQDPKLLQNPENMDFGVDFVVLGVNNNVLYSSKEAFSRMTVEEAIKKRYPYQYIIRDDSIAGVVILPEDMETAYRARTVRLLIALILGGVILLGGAVGFGLYVNSRIVKPFEEMEAFAGKVAAGKLDEPLMMEKDNMFGAFTESFDIMREELDASKKRELALQRKEKELVASLSHDLKTPITGIKLTTELMKAKVDGSDEWMDEKLDNIYKKADQIDVLVSDLFSATLDDLGEFKVNCRDEESSVLSDIIKKNDDRGLVSESEMPKLIINIDVKRMNQVIGNILVNSYKYAGTKIEVEYKLAGEFLEMRISDFGPGVPASEIDLITNKFYRGKAVEETAKEGSGLGLYISKILMEKMNGELICESEGQGFTAILMIPLS